MAEPDIQNQELPLETVGSRLRRAREATGLSLADISARTKIAERHLAAIQEDRFGDLASRTYAVGFARAYARTVGLDEAEVAEAVRAALAAGEESWDAPQPAPFEPGDPARIPGSRIAWLAALGAVAVIVLVVVFWRSYVSPAASLPELTADQADATEAAAPVASGSAAPLPAGPVVFTALEPNVWVKFYDAGGNQLMQKQMAQGETYTVPADAAGPLLRTARPDALQITVGGRAVAPLADEAVIVRDVPVSAAALLARAAPGVSSSAPTAPAPTATPAPAASPRPAAEPVRAAASPAARPTTPPDPRPSAASAQNPPSPSPPSSPPPSPVPAAVSAPAAAPTPVEGSAESSTVSE